MVPDKLDYTAGEKAAEISCGAAAALFCITETVMIAAGMVSGGNIIILVSMLICYGAFSLCSVYPQHTNIFRKPEEVSEKKFHAARRGFIIGKAALTTAIFALSLPLWG